MILFGSRVVMHNQDPPGLAPSNKVLAYGGVMLHIGTKKKERDCGVRV